MSIKLRAPKEGFKKKLLDFVFITTVFDGVHRAHRNSTQKMGLDVYRDSVTNMTRLEHFASSLIQKCPRIFNNRIALGIIRQEPFYLRLAQETSAENLRHGFKGLRGALYAIEKKKGSATVTLDNIGVRKQKRESETARKDVAIALVKDFMCWASQRGHKEFRAEILYDNEDSMSVLYELGITSTKTIFARNIAPRAIKKKPKKVKPLKLSFLTASVKHQSKRSWYEHSTLELQFNDAAKDASAEELANDIREAMTYGAQKGCGFVEAEIRKGKDWKIRNNLLAQNFQEFKHIYEGALPLAGWSIKPP